MSNELYDRASRNQPRRWGAFALAALLEVGLGVLIVLGLAAPAQLRSGVQAALTAFEVAPPPPPPKPPHHAPHAGAAAPPARRAKATAVVAPPVPHPLASPRVAAPVPGVGTAPRNGASDLAGSGSGAGGVGSGTGSGSGSGGEGDGDGGSDAEWIHGKITDSDYPASARDAHAQGVTRTEIAVGVDGRPSGCTVRKSSGNALLDETTCRLVMKRFRFRPARDGAGNAVADSVDYEQEWSITGYAGD